MKNGIITSNKTALFSGGQLFLLFIALMVISLASSIEELKNASWLIWLAVFIRKKKEINVENRTFKDGPFSKKLKLPASGYISVVRKINKASKKIDKEGLQLLYVSEKKPYHIYSANDYEELVETALYLHSHWDSGVYEVHTKTWLKEQSQ